jgi:hypothetical protein
VEGGETVQETAQPVHLPVVRALRGGRKGRQDAGARHRRGRGDEGEFVVSGHASFGVSPGQSVQFVAGVRFDQSLQGLYADPGERRFGLGDLARLRYA